MAPALHDAIERQTLSPYPQDPRSYAQQNRLLAGLPEVDYARLRRTLGPVVLPLGRVLGEAGCRAEHAYFPVWGLLSLMQHVLAET